MFSQLSIPYDAKMLFNTVKLKPDVAMEDVELAIGEIVNPDGGGGFEGYYKNPEADAERVRRGVYWTGDLGYRDEAGGG